MLTIGHAYEFTFDTGFTDLDGIYKVTHAMTYDSVLLDEVDLYVNLYKPAGKSEQDLETDLPDYVDRTFYRFESVIDTTVLYVPDTIIVGIPAPDVREYAKVMLSVNLGVFADPTLLASLVNTMQQVLEGSHGILDIPIVATYDTTWMSESAYEAIVAAREAAATGTTNYYSDNLVLQQEVADKNAEIAALEIIIAQQDAIINP